VTAPAVVALEKAPPATNQMSPKSQRDDSRAKEILERRNGLK
jgi:hypothetical protein